MWNVIKNFKKNAKAVALALTLVSMPGMAMAQNFLVLGVIASSKNRQGIALMKDMTSSRTFAVKEGQSFSSQSVIKQVNRKAVEVVINGKSYIIQVGGETATAIAQGSTGGGGNESYSADNVEKVGDTINISRSFKEHLINNSLAKILMQAAAVPHFIDGRLSGFQLWEIEPNSVFDAAGLKDGDLVTAVNGNDISDVGTTIRQLNSLKSAQEATFDYVRNGIKQQLKIIVQ